MTIGFDPLDDRPWAHAVVAPASGTAADTKAAQSNIQNFMVHNSPSWSRFAGTVLAKQRATPAACSQAAHTVPDCAD